MTSTMTSTVARSLHRRSCHVPSKCKPEGCAGTEAQARCAEGYFLTMTSNCSSGSCAFSCCQPSTLEEWRAGCKELGNNQCEKMGSSCMAAVSPVHYLCRYTCKMGPSDDLVCAFEPNVAVEL
eukprot:TRINITY_DN23017_c0_g1_i3.p1 TRINITY_DN23017_c0_g1~~TRINITY_DN23017_c0_g1_i3.p1  ORF type:complete len:143 (+),score=12.99 TRINITY_DN23017_c0_g1_i3:63-431(+)